MEASDDQQALANSGRHRAPDGDAQTAFIPRITDASPDGVPGGPLDPPAALGTAAWPTSSGGAARSHPISPAVASSLTAAGNVTPPPAPGASAPLPAPGAN